MNFTNKNNDLGKNKKSISKTLLIVILSLFVSVSVFAQRPNSEKIQALKIAHITEQMDLTKDEAQKFWPIYNANEKAENKLRQKTNENRKIINPNDLSESEAKTMLKDMIEIEKEKVALRSKLLNDLLEILPAKKIVALIKAERSFRRKMVEEFKERHSGRRRN
jgi:Spy/CpxP family protein refolding chaperone